MNTEARVEFFEDAAGEHRFRVLAGNHEILSSSEGYVSRANAHRGWEAMAKAVLQIWELGAEGA